MSILYNADGTPLGLRDAVHPNELGREAITATLTDWDQSHREVKAYFYRALRAAGLITLGIVIGKVVL